MNIINKADKESGLIIRAELSNLHTQVHQAVGGFSVVRGGRLSLERLLDQVSVDQLAQLTLDQLQLCILLKQ